MSISYKIKIKLQKRKLKKAYVNYVKCVQEFGCGETLANHISSEARRLNKKLNEEYVKMKELDPACPPLETRLLN